MAEILPGWPIGRIVIAVIVIAAVLAILYVVLPALGIVIPAVFETIFWIVLLAVVAIVAVKIIISQL